MLHELYVVCVIGAFTLWLVCSVILQFSPSWFSCIERHDLFMLLPRWTFFAPRPGISDYHLLYRDQLEDGSLSNWVEIPITDERKLFSFLWNPEKKSKKILSDVVATLLQLDTREGIALMLSLPYLILLNTVVHHGEQRAKIKRQFVLVEKSRHEENPTIQVALISAFHPLERAQDTQATISDSHKLTGEADDAIAPADSA
jgi:hypothetical protein